MEDWVVRGMQRWPNVPALFGWLRLTRRGRWLLKGEPINRPQIIEAINHNYACDEHGRWYFQNGPQRGYVHLEYAPLVLHTTDCGESWRTHTGLLVTTVSSAFIDELGAVLLMTEHGAGVVVDDDLDWVLQRITITGHAIDETQLAAALALPTGNSTALVISICGRSLQLTRLDVAQAPEQLHYVREPKPVGTETTAECHPDG